MPAVGQDPRFPNSRKRTGATWRKRLKSGEVRGGLGGPEDRVGARKAQSTQPRARSQEEGKEERGRGCPGLGRSSGGGNGGPGGWQCPARPGQGDAGPGARKGDTGPVGLLASPGPGAGGEAGGSARRGRGWETVPLRWPCCH